MMQEQITSILLKAEFQTNIQWENSNLIFYWFTTLEDFIQTARGLAADARLRCKTTEGWVPGCYQQANEMLLYPTAPVAATAVASTASNRP